MNSTYPMPPAWVSSALRDGLLIPAHPLALTRSRKLDETHQRALTRYYHAAGAGGVAVGVHTTQFEIRDPRHGLFGQVMTLARAVIADCDRATQRRSVCIAGICGRTRQAVTEARFAVQTGYHAGLLSLGAFRGDSEQSMIRHCQRVAREIPIFGFYLQPAVGGRVLSVDFWRRFAEIPNVVAIKVAAFNRYQTFDVVRAVAEAGRANDIALYTGNDDHIVLDLLSVYEVPTTTGPVRLRFVGGLLGHWACWTHAASRIFQACKRQRGKRFVPADLMTVAAQVTDCNAALFDPAHGYAGCIAGIHEVLSRQGLLANRVCLDTKQGLSPGQKEEIDRVYRVYPEHTDDGFVNQHLHEWLAG